MNITKGIFRGILIVSILTAVMGLLASFTTEASLPEPLRLYLRQKTQTEATLGDMVRVSFGAMTLILSIISVVGLYRFWPPARLLTLLTWVLALAFQPFTGPHRRIVIDLIIL